MVQDGHQRTESDSSDRGDRSDAEDEDMAYVRVSRAELMRGHRPVVVSEVPVYVALEDREGRRFEDKGSCQHVKYRWMRGPVIEPCFFHPHKMSQIRDVAKTFNHYCSRECFLRGWHHLSQHQWGKKPDNEVEELLGEWTQVASTRQYCPSQNDINRPLRMDIIPLTKDGRECVSGMMSITTGTVIPTPKEARMRQMISNGGQFNAEWLGKQFKVMNWNILADLYATENVYPYCEKWALSWNWRKHLIIKELKSMAADIITLQEVQKDAFEEWFRPTLLEAGYEGIFQAKKRDPIFHRGKYTTEGCATFFKNTRFKRLDKAIFDYDKLSAQELRASCTDSEVETKALHRVNRGNIALAVILEDRLQKKNQNGQGHILCVVNTHILCDPAAADVKLFQAHLLLKAIQGTTACRMPIVVCGDFNSTPDSAVYEYFRRGQVRQDHEDLKKDPCGLMRCVQLHSGSCMATAYETCTGKEATFTNYTEDFKGTLDYIWFSPDNLSVLAISQVDDEAQLSQESALPSSTRPSDHVSLVATFMFHDAQEEQQVQPRRGMTMMPSHAHSNMAHQMGHYHVQHGTAPGGDGMYTMGAMGYPQQYL